MSLSHDVTTPLSDVCTRQASPAETDHDVTLDPDGIRKNAVHLAHLGYPAAAIEDYQVWADHDYQVSASRGRNNNRCRRPDPNTIIPEHLWSRTSPEFQRAWMDKPDNLQ